MDARCTSGGICKLRELIDEHPAELAYDFRSKFGLSYQQIGFEINLLEACLLVAMLLRDPSSWLQAKVNDWKFPVTPEWMITANLLDVTVAVNSKGKPKPMERPWPSTDINRIGGNTKHDQNKIREVLDSLRIKEDTDGN